MASPLRVWVDGQCLQTDSRFRGIGRYVSELLAALMLCPDVEVVVSLNAALPPPAGLLGAAAGQPTASLSVRWWESIVASGEAVSGNTLRRQVSAIALSHHVACLAPDVAISASPFEGGDNPAVPLEPLNGFGIPVASIFYDAIPYRFPAEHLARPRKRAFYLRRFNLHHAFDANLAISDFCAGEARALFPARPAVTISTGISSELFGKMPASDPAAVTTRAPYVLYVGGLDWRKNVPTAIMAFALLPRSHRDGLRFIVAGKTTASEISDLQIRWVAAGLPAQQLEFTGHVTDRELLALYHGCELLVQPSRMEGFGLTAAEAMLAGVPVVGGNAGALPEVIGMPELLFDPDRPDELARIMVKVLERGPFRAAAVAHGVQQARQFTWDRTAGLMVEACRTLASQDRPRTRGREAARSWTKAQVKELDLPWDWIAGVLARAEAGALEGAQPIRS